MTSRKRISSADLDAALRELLRKPDAAFEETWARMRGALATAPAVRAADAAIGDEEEEEEEPGAAEGPVIEVRPRGSSMYEVFPVFEVHTDAPVRRREALAITIDAATRQIGMFAPRAWRADWSLVRLRDGRRTYPLVEPIGVPLGPEERPGAEPDLEAQVDADTAERLVALAKSQGGSKP